MSDWTKERYDAARAMVKMARHGRQGLFVTELAGALDEIERLTAPVDVEGEVEEWIPIIFDAEQGTGALDEKSTYYRVGDAIRPLVEQKARLQREVERLRINVKMHEDGHILLLKQARAEIARLTKERDAFGRWYSGARADVVSREDEIVRLKSTPSEAWETLRSLAQDIHDDKSCDEESHRQVGDCRKCELGRALAAVSREPSASSVDNLRKKHATSSETTLAKMLAAWDEWDPPSPEVSDEHADTIDDVSHVLEIRGLVESDQLTTTGRDLRDRIERAQRSVPPLTAERAREVEAERDFRRRVDATRKWMQDPPCDGCGDPVSECVCDVGRKARGEPPFDRRPPTVKRARAVDMADELLESLESVEAGGWTLPTGSNALVKSSGGHLTVIQASLLRSWRVKVREIRAAAGEYGRSEPLTEGHETGFDLGEVDSSGELCLVLHIDEHKGNAWLSREMWGRMGEVAGWTSESITAAEARHTDDDTCPACSDAFGGPSPCAKTHDFEPGAYPTAANMPEWQREQIGHRVAGGERATLPADYAARRAAGEGGHGMCEPVERLCVAVLVTDPAGRVLLVRHRKRAWELPGGGVHEGEEPCCAAVREVQEETGIVVTLQGRPTELAGTPKPGAEYPSRILVFRATGEGEPRAGSDATWAEWMTPWEVLRRHREAPETLSDLASKRVLLEWANQGHGAGE